MKLQFLTWREWRLRPGRAVLTVLSVAFAVAVVFGSSLAASMVRHAYAAVSTALEGPPVVDILAAQGGRFSPDGVPSIKDLKEVREAVPLLFRVTSAHVAGKRWRTMALGLGERSSPVWSRLELASGRLPQAGREALIDASVAQSLGLQLPQQITVLARRGTVKLNVVGAVAPASLREYGDGVTLVLPLYAAQQTFGLQGQVDRVRLFVNAREDCEAVQKELAGRLPAELIVRAPANRVRLAEEILRSTELALQFGGMLALAMAAFIILNTLRMNFSERRWQFAVMRAIGATAAQVQRLVMIEGLWFGICGLILGIPAGLLLAYALAGAMQALLGADLPPAQPGIKTIVLGVSVGPLVAVLAAWCAARQARRLSPLEGMLGVEPVGLEHYPRKALLLSIVTWVAATGCLAGVAWGALRVEWAIPAGLIMLVAFIFFIPAVLLPFMQTITWMLRGSLATTAMLAARQAEQRTMRMGLTVGVLVVALSNGLGLGHAILNNVDDVRGWYRRSMSGDYFLQRIGGPSPSTDLLTTSEPTRELREMPGISRVETIHFRQATAADEPVTCVSREFSPAFAMPWQMPLDEEKNLRRALENSQLVVSSVLAKRLSLRQGDNVRLEISGRSHSLTVAAIVNDYTLGGQVVFLDRAAAERFFDARPADLYVLTRAADAPVGLEENLRKFAASHNCLLQSFAELRQQFDRLINGVVGSLFVLMGMGFVVSGLGVSNTLAMSVLEQTRELGLLRIVGMTRGQVRRLILVEGALIGTIGIVLGTLAGITTAYMIHVCNWALLDRNVAFEIHGWLFVLSTVGCLVVTLLAAWTPAQRASRIDLLTAIAYD